MRFIILTFTLFLSATIKTEEQWSFPLLQNQNITTHKKVEMTDTLENKQITIPAGAHLKVVESNGKNFLFQAVDLKGTVLLEGRFFEGSFDITPMVMKLSEKTLENRSFDPFYDIHGTSSNCLDCQMKQLASYDKTSYDRLTEMARKSYDETYAKTKSRDKATNACVQALTTYYQSDEAVWSGLDLNQRATLTYQRILNMYRRLTSEPEASIIKGMTTWSQISDPNKWHILVKPEAATCTAFVELRGNEGLRPNMINYTFCQKNNNSTAQGLGQMTKTTFKLLRGNEEVSKDKNNYLPITQSPSYNNLDDDRLFASMNDNVDLQIEVLLRTINYLVKMRKKTNQHNDGRILRLAIADYDQDSASTYLQMFDQCMACFHNKKPGEPPSKCKVTDP